MGIIQARNKNSEKKFRAKSKATRRTEIAVLVLHQNRCESLSARDGTEAVPVDSIQNSIPSSVVVVATTEKISHVDILFGLFLLSFLLGCRGIGCARGGGASTTSSGSAADAGEKGGAH